MMNRQHYIYASYLLLSAIAASGCAENAEGPRLSFENSSDALNSSEGIITPPQTSKGSYTETFSKGSNVGNWSIAGSYGDTFPAIGGNPGAYLRDANLFAPAPAMYTSGSSLFTGNYADSEVTALAVDLRLNQWVWAPSSSDIHLVLTNFNGTPSSLDDAAVWFDTQEPSPAIDEGWASYRVKLESDSAGLPANWVAYEAGHILTGNAADKVWRRVIEQVDQVSWSWGAPLAPNFFGDTDSAMDNAAITRNGS